MATDPRNPMFGDLDSTRALQRLPAGDGNETANSALGMALDDARTTFYSQLGLSRTGLLTALSESPDPPTTDDHHLWLLARSTEQRAVRRYLLRLLTTMVKEGSAAPLQEFNDIGAFREMESIERVREIERLDQELAAAFGILSGTIAAGDQAPIRASAIGSLLADKFRVVGFSVYATPAYLFHFSLDRTTAT